MSALDVVLGGITGRILRVDLSGGRTWIEESEPYVRRTLGGRGTNTQIMLDEVAPGTAWDDEANLLCFGPGTLVGTPAPGACRTDVSSVSVFTGGKGSANAGGFFGAALKFAGFDNVVFSGKSESPVYLLIENGVVELRDAAHLWGRTTYETEALLAAELGPGKLEIAQIGPAGENQVRGSAVIMNAARAAGGSGVGCVMGAKKLKAVAVRGNGPVRVADMAGYMRAVDRCMAQCRANMDKVRSMRKSLTERMTDMDFEGWDSIMVVRNGQEDFWPLERRLELMDRTKGVPSMHQSVRACATCPCGCAAYLRIPRGPYAGRHGEGFWINTVMSASRFDLGDPEAVVAFWLRANELGLDTDYAAASLSWVIECFEKGLIGPKDTGGLHLRFADGAVLMELVDMLAYRQHIGDLVADGAFEAAQKIGGEAPYLLAHVKGQPSIEPFRIPKGWGLGVVTSPVAGRHLRGATRGEAHSGPAGLGHTVADWAKQARSVVWQARTKEIEDNLGICVYTGTWSGAHFLNPENYAELVRTGLGLEVDTDTLMNHYAPVGRALEKAFNALHTPFTRADDLPPERFRREPVLSGPYAGQVADEAGYNAMLDEFYALSGWDRASGDLTRAHLESLGLSDLAERLSRAGKLTEPS